MSDKVTYFKIGRGFLTGFAAGLLIGLLINPGAERHFICGDKNGEYVAIARRRLADTDPFQARMLSPDVMQPSLFGQGRG